MQAQSCEAETEGRSWSTSTVLRKFRSGQWGVFEPKSPIKGIPHFKVKGLPWFPPCTQSSPESSPWKARPWSKCCAGRHGDKGRDGEKWGEEDGRGSGHRKIQNHRMQLSHGWQVPTLTSVSVSSHVDFHAAPGVKNPSCNTWFLQCSIPGKGTKIWYVTPQLSPCTATTEPKHHKLESTMDDPTQYNEDPVPVNKYFFKKERTLYILLMKEIKAKSEKDKYHTLMHRYRI